MCDNAFSSLKNILTCLYILFVYFLIKITLCVFLDKNNSRSNWLFVGPGMYSVSW